MPNNGLISSRGVSAPPFSIGPYTWDQHVTFTGGVSGVNTGGSVYFVDGTNGADGNDGKSWSNAKVTIQAAVTAASAGDTIYITAKDITDWTGDPTSYEENITIPAATSSLALIGVSRGRTQGGLPQLKDGATTTQHILRIRAPGCLISNLGFNGAGNTGGGILLDDDYAAKAGFGTTITGCHFKNCKGSTATNAATGGAINWSSTGNSWQVYIGGNKFYKCVGDIVLPGTTNTVPQDVVIEGNIFSGPAGSVDCNIYTGGSGINGLYIWNNVFPCMPALGSGTNVRAIKVTGSVGILAGNYFGFPTQGSGIKTTGAAGTGNIVPTTMIISGNYGEADTEGDTGYVFRT